MADPETPTSGYTYYEGKSTFSEGWYPRGPETPPDWLPDPHTWSYGFVVNPASAGYPPGTPLNTYAGPGVDSSVGGSGLVPSGEAHYYSGYWAGVQAALYWPAIFVNPTPWGRFYRPWGPRNPFRGPDDGHPFMWQPEDLQWKPNTHVASLSTASPSSNGSNSVTPGTGGANIAVNPSEMMWLSPATGNSLWDMQRGVDDFPASLPDWGERAPGPLLPLLVPMAAPRASDGMPGVNWTSATNLYGEPTSVPVLPVMPVAPPEWNIPAAGTGLSGGTVFSGGAEMLTDVGTPNWIENFFQDP